MQDFKAKNTTVLYLAIALSSAAVFVADLSTALGIVVWVFYLAPLILTLLSWRPWLPLLVAAVHSGLAIVGFILSPPGISPQIAFVNRGFGVATLWIVAGAAAYFIRGKLAVRRHDWLQSGQALLSEKMAIEQTLQQLGENVLRCLAEYLGAQAGAIFIEEGGVFRRIAGYALPSLADVPERFLPGDGLLGQAARDTRAFVISDVPEGYLSVGSGLGQSRPRHLLIAPAIVDGAANAVLELGFIHPVDEAASELMARVSTAIALTVRSVRFRAALEEMLEETQRQAEEIQVQSEELRFSNEELEKHNQALNESQERLERQQAELEQTNAQLEEQARTLETQKEELIEARTALESKAQELEQASRYKSDFLASMSHELRTPLNSALILARLLFENRLGNLTPEQVEYARSIEASGNALLELINDVLDLAKVEAGRMEVRAQHVAISKVAESLRSMFEPMAKQKNLALNIRISPDAPASLRSDPQRLEQVLKNLLSNAIKFTAQGEVSLQIGRAADGRIAFAVSDTGIGIPEDQRSLVFEPFRQVDSTLDRKYGGTGLGLSISRELSRLLGGEIRLESTVGGGSTFTLLLPDQYEPLIVNRPGSQRWEDFPKAVAATAAGSGPAGLPVTSPVGQPAPFAESGDAPSPRVRDDRDKLTGGQRVILIVEDDELFAHILRDLAHELNFQCLTSRTATEAFVLALQYAPSAIVLDVGLPDKSGLSLLDRLKSDVRTRHIPVHMVSVHDYTETALSLGAVGYILKPVKRDHLIDAFQRLESRLSQRLRRVLIVEDDPVQSESLCHLLASRDVETICAASAAECLEQLGATSFDCMVLDLSLPDGSGLALLETLSREDRYSFPPVIVYTGRELTPAEEQALRRYSNSIIIKGARSPERLLDEVTLFLHQVVADLPPEQQRMLERARSRDAVLDGRQILLVEDDVRNVFALTSILEQRGAQVQIARNGREALEALERSLQDGAPRIDLVLMDIMMPEMDGIAATREIRRRAAWKKLPIIALTAKAMKSDQEQVIASGANDYMAKPLDVEQLLSVMRVWMPR